MMRWKSRVRATTLEFPRAHVGFGSALLSLRLKKAVITEPVDNRLQNLPDGTKKPSQTEKDP
jgi:hypothetical protein